MPTAPRVASHMASLKSNKLPECFMCRSPHPLHVPGLSSLNHLFLSFFYKSIFVLSYFSLVVTYSFTFSITLSWCFSIILCSRFIVCFSYIWQQLASKFAVCHHSTEWEECNVRKKHLISKIVHYYYWSLLLEPDRCICRGYRPLLAI